MFCEIVKLVQNKSISVNVYHSHTQHSYGHYHYQHYHDYQDYHHHRHHIFFFGQWSLPWNPLRLRTCYLFRNSFFFFYASKKNMSLRSSFVEFLKWTSSKGKCLFFSSKICLFILQLYCSSFYLNCQDYIGALIYAFPRRTVIYHYYFYFHYVIDYSFHHLYY